MMELTPLKSIWVRCIFLSHHFSIKSVKAEENFHFLPLSVSYVWMNRNNNNWAFLSFNAFVQRYEIFSRNEEIIELDHYSINLNEGLGYTRFCFVMSICFLGSDELYSIPRRKWMNRYKSVFIITKPKLVLLQRTIGLYTN